MIRSRERIDFSVKEKDEASPLNRFNGMLRAFIRAFAGVEGFLFVGGRVLAVELKDVSNSELVSETKTNRYL